MPELYKFENLLKYLEELGFNIRDLGDYKVINVDFEQIVKGGKVSFENGFINFVDKENKLHPGYCYKKYYAVNYAKQKASNKNPYPKKHLCKCKTIKEYIDSGNFQENYFFSTSQTCEIIDIDTEEIYKDVKLDICKNCKKELSKKMRLQYDDINDYINVIFRTIMNNSNMPQIKLDIFGYTTNWEKISKKRRQEERYTCQNCGFKAKNIIEKQYIEVHHKDRDKLNNDKSNLIVLCTECHSKIDDIHKRNFSFGVNKIRIEQLQEIKRNNHKSKTKSKTTHKPKREQKKQ